MRTDETTFNLASEQNTRIAITASIVLSIAVLSLSSLLTPEVLETPRSTATLVEILVVFGQVLTIISGIALIYRGSLEQGAWRIFYSFLVTGIFRVLVRESIGIPLGFITAIVVSTTGYLALPARNASRVALLGYGVGGAIVLFDIYGANFYGRQPTSEALAAATRNLAILIFFVEMIVLIAHRRTLSFASKIASYYSLLSLVSVIVVVFSSIQVLQAQVASGNDVTGFAALALIILQRRMVITGVLVSLLGAVLGVMIARTLTDPLRRLSKTTSDLEKGHLEARATGFAEDEIGEVATAFNHMADSLKGLFGQLESRVEERTRDLQRRAVELQAAAEIGRAATTLRDLDSLLERSVQLITERFGFYHAGIFLVDQAGEYAVLHAASSEGGQRMLTLGHRLKIGETGIVGYVTQTGKARIALDVGQDAVYFDNPHLPGTHSEMALPLIAAGQILGALDVQSTEKEAFQEDDISTLQILADQLTIAIQNARLFGETQAALETTRVAYGNLSRNAWGKIIRHRPRVSYIAAGPGSVQVNNTAPTTDVVRTVETGDVILSTDGHTIGIPIKIRGQSIGALRLKKQDSSSSWSHDEITLAIALSEQLSGALESARLYKESQERAARETLVSDISAHITALPRVDTILRETVQELGQTFGNAAVTFQLLETPDVTDPIQGPANGSDPVPSNGKDKG